MAADRRRALELLVDLTVYAPIGLLALARDHLDELTARGHGQVGGRVELARRLGKAAVELGRDEVAKRTAPSNTAVTAPLDTDGREPPPTSGDDTADRAHAATSSSDLPIDGYEHLAASQIVERLAALSPADLDAVERFESAHRNRRTIHGRIAQLRAAR